MREKLLDLMKYEGLKPSQLAELLGINPAGISHILAGRNKPGFDLLQKMLRRFPRINPDWLLLDTGPMYRADSPVTENSGINGNPGASKNAASPIPEVGGLFGQTEISAPATQPLSEIRNGASPSRESIDPAADSAAKKTTAVRRVVIFYEDDTFESYSPTLR